MYFSSLVTLALGLVSVAHSAPVVARAILPPAFLLAGDSTVATNGGWGDALIALLAKGATGTNYARNGKTTVDFRSGGYWQPVLDQVKKLKSTNQVFVTIQFGHNDQKPEKGITIAMFQTNLSKMVDEVIAAGGTPILITPLSRRAFSGSPAIIKESLRPQADAAIAVATAKKITALDLNRVSVDYVNKIGQANADLYNLAAGDRTHLNAKGKKVFGTMVAGLLRAKKIGGTYVGIDAAIEKAIAEGNFILPSA